MTQTSRTASARRLSPIKMPTGTPRTRASTSPATTRKSVMVTSVATRPPAISPHNARVVSTGPGRISGGSVSESSHHTIIAVRRDRVLSTGRHLHDRCAWKREARSGRAAAGHLLGFQEKSSLVDAQDLTIPHNDAPIDHDISDVAATCAVNKRLHRIEERREMRLPCLNGNQIGPLPHLNGSRLKLADCVRSLSCTHPESARGGERAGIFRRGFRGRACVFHAL